MHTYEIFGEIKLQAIILRTDNAVIVEYPYVGTPNADWDVNWHAEEPAPRPFRAKKLGKGKRKVSKKDMVRMGAPIYAKWVSMCFAGSEKYLLPMYSSFLSHYNKEQVVAARFVESLEGVVDVVCSGRDVVSYYCSPSSDDRLLKSRGTSGKGKRIRTISTAQVTASI